MVHLDVKTDLVSRKRFFELVIVHFNAIDLRFKIFVNFFPILFNLYLFEGRWPLTRLLLRLRSRLLLLDALVKHIDDHTAFIATVLVARARKAIHDQIHDVLMSVRRLDHMSDVDARRDERIVMFGGIAEDLKAGPTAHTRRDIVIRIREAEVERVR